jgi:hypothetical protein
MRSLLPSIAMNLTKTVPADGRVDVVRASAMEAEARRQMAFAHRRGASFRKDRPHRLPSVPSDARAVLMHANDGCVDHLHRNIMSLSECAHNLGPNASSSPVSETIVAGRVRAEVVRQVAPWRPRSQDAEDSVEDTTIIHSWRAARLVRQHRIDGSPFLVGEFVTHDSAPSVWVLNHGLTVSLTSPASGGLVAMRAKRTH